MQPSVHYVGILLKNVYGLIRCPHGWGGAMIMLGSPSEGEFGRLQSMPALLGGTTQSPYMIVEDADAIYRNAKALGAEIVIEIKDEDYGGRGFSCRDPEGHLWSIGTYDPWKGKS